MTIKAITFLGLGPYHKAAYFYKDKEYITSLFPLALAEFCEPQPEQWIVCVTKESRETEYFKTLKTALNAQPFLIPWGKDDEQLWEIFNALVELVEPGDQVIFDITHGLRSLPLIVFLASTYLKAAKNIELKGIFYGAFDVRDRDVTPNRTPVFDLTPFISLLDWLTATDRFTQTGDGRPLAALLKQAAYFEHPKRVLTPEEQMADDASKRISLVAKYIEDVSGSLLTNLILQAEVSSHKLVGALQKAEPDLAAKAPPYRLVAGAISQSYLPFANTVPMSNVLEDLRLQLAMIRWYLANGQIPQAATLMREWVVTALGFKFGLDSEQILAHKHDRKAIELTLGKAIRKQRKRFNNFDDKSDITFDDQFNNLPNAESIATFWNQLTQFRNLINHGAMKKSWRVESGKIIDGLRQSAKSSVVDELYKTLEQIAESLDIISSADSEVGISQSNHRRAASQGGPAVGNHKSEIEL